MGKHPRITKWTENASNDFDEVTRWWTQWPSANIGLATGRASGVVVMDVDPRNGGLDEILRLSAEHGWEHDGPIVATGGGGWHYFFAAPEQPITNNHPFPGIDIQADGQQVVLPPSVHYTGVGYEWTENGPDVPLPEMPEWLLAACATRPLRAKSGGVATLLPRGGRNAGLASFGGSLRAKGASEHVIFAALMAYNDEVCDPPLDRTEVAQIAASVSRYEPSEGVPVLGSAPAAGGGRVKAGPYTPETFTAADLQYEVLPEMRWAVGGLIAEGLCVCAGRAKLGKSFMMLGISLAVAQGGIALGDIPVTDGDVLYLALEDNKRRLQKRLTMMVPEGDAWPERLNMEIQWPRSEDGGLEAISAFIGQHQHLRLVVIDTLARFRTLPHGRRNTNAYQEDYEFAAGVQQLAMQHGIAIVVVTHLNKSLHDDYVDKISGSVGLPGAADTILYLDRQRGRGGQEGARLRVTGRDIEEQDYKMTFDPVTGQWEIAGEWEGEQKSKERDDLLAVMRKIGNPVTPDDIAAALGKTRPAAYKALYRAALDGAILSHKGKLFTLPDLGGVNGSSENAALQETLSYCPPVRLSAEGSPFNNSESESIKSVKAGEQALHREGGAGGPLPTPLSVHHPRTKDTDNADNADSKLVDLTNRPGSPDRPCPVCGETNWLPRAAGGWVCNTCKSWREEV